MIGGSGCGSDGRMTFPRPYRGFATIDRRRIAPYTASPERCRESPAGASRRGNQARSERVAQTVEHVTFNHGVLGSIPSALTNKINQLTGI